MYTLQQGAFTFYDFFLVAYGRLSDVLVHRVGNVYPLSVYYSTLHRYCLFGKLKYFTGYSKLTLTFQLYHVSCKNRISVVTF